MQQGTRQGAADLAISGNKTAPLGGVQFVFFGPDPVVQVEQLRHDIALLGDLAECALRDGEHEAHRFFSRNALVLSCIYRSLVWGAS